MAVIIEQDGQPYLPEPDEQQYPALTNDAQIRQYLKELIRSLREYFSTLKTDADVLASSIDTLTAYITLLSVYAAGTAYSLTNTPALLNFGTTDPSLTITKAGTWLLLGRVNIKYNGATFIASRTVTIKIRRTNNTAADIANTTSAFATGIVTTFTENFAVADMQPVFYTTTNTNDVLEIWGSIDTVPSAGSIDTTEASLIAIRLT